MQKDGDLWRRFVGREDARGVVEAIGVGERVGVGKIRKAKRAHGGIEFFRRGQGQAAQKHGPVRGGLGVEVSGIFCDPRAGVLE